MSPPETSRARILLLKAGQDLQAVRSLAADEEVVDEIVGFHAQQCVEKALKAVLLAGGMGEQRTHDLGRLLQLLGDLGFDPPPSYEDLDELTIYAVPLRYDQLLDAEALDRGRLLARIEDLAQWAQARLDGLA